MIEKSDKCRYEKGGFIDGVKNWWRVPQSFDDFSTLRHPSINHRFSPDPPQLRQVEPLLVAFQKLCSRPVPLQLSHFSRFANFITPLPESRSK